MNIGTAEGYLEVQVELLVHFLAPLLAQRSGAQDEHPSRQTPQGEFLDRQAGFDGLTETDLVGEDSATAQTRQRMSGDGLLVRHTVDVGDVDGQQFLEIIERGKFFTLQPQLDQLEVVEACGFELFAEQDPCVPEEADRSAAAG